MSRLEPSAGLGVIGRVNGPLLAKERGMSALLIARFDGDVEELTRSYDRAHALIMNRGGATSFGELRHLLKPLCQNRG